MFLVFFDMMIQAVIIPLKSQQITDDKGFATYLMLKEIINMGGFNLRKWYSNSANLQMHNKEVIKHITRKSWKKTCLMQSYC